MELVLSVNGRLARRSEFRLAFKAGIREEQLALSRGLPGWNMFEYFHVAEVARTAISPILRLERILLSNVPKFGEGPALIH